MYADFRPPSASISHDVCAVGDEHAADAVDPLAHVESSAPERTGGAHDQLAGGEGHDADDVAGGDADGNGDEANCTPV